MAQDRGSKPQDDSLTGLAKRWLKTQLRFHGDPQKAVGDRQEAEQLEGQMRQRVSDDARNTVINAVMPSSWKQKLQDIERRTEESEAARARQQRAEHEGRSRAAVRIVISGDVSGSFEDALPVSIDRPEEAGEAMTVELEPLDPIVLGGHEFLLLQFAVPNFHGPGTYDLNTMAEEPEAEDWDFSWFQLCLDQNDEPYFWSPECGPAAIEVGADARTLRVTMTMEDAGSSRVKIDAAVELP